MPVIRLISLVPPVIAAAAIASAATPQEEIAAKVPAARAILDAWQAQDPAPAERKLHVILWTPSDREPAPRYRERLTAALADIRNFYAREMDRLGFGPLTLRFDHDDDGLLRIHIVPREYRIHFPEELKSHASHDIAAICNPCAITFSSAQTTLRKQIMAELGISQKVLPPTSESRRTQRAAGALLTSAKSMPTARVQELRRELALLLHGSADVRSMRTEPHRCHVMAAQLTMMAVCL